MKDALKYLYKFKNYYTIDEIINLIKKNLPKDKINFFNEYYVYRALNDLLPITENDFNTFNDTLYNQYNLIGYLIYRENYYIF